MIALSATREGYCLAVVTIRREGNNSRVGIREIWWLTGLVFWWQQMMMATARGLGWVELVGAWLDLAAAVWSLGVAYGLVQVEVWGIVLRSVVWALWPRLV